MNNSKHLRIAGLLQLLLGIASILAIRFLLGTNETPDGLSQPAVQSAFFGVTFLYCVNGFKILAGLLGICLAGKKSLLTVILGVLLFVAQLASFVQTNGDMVRIIISVISLAIPYYYLHNAYKIYRQ